MKAPGSRGPRRALRWCGAVAVATLLTLTVAPIRPVLAAPCLAITKGQFNAAGPDGVMPGLDGEWVKVKNRCSVSVSLAGWHLRDSGPEHVFTFPAQFRLAPHAWVKVHSGTGTNTASNLFWGRTSGQVWDNRPPEWAYLVSPDGTIASRWSWPLAPVVSRGSPAQPVLALTIDDGYNPSICREIFDILRTNRVAATWFPIAGNLDRPLWDEIAAAGYPIANHTLTHASLPGLSIGAQYDQLRDARLHVENRLGITMLPAVRPPYGAYDARTQRAATAAGFKVVVTWDATFADTAVNATVQHQISRAPEVRNGSVVLMHCNPHTPAILRAVIPVYRARGYGFVTIGQMFGLGGSVPDFSDQP